MVGGSGPDAPAVAAGACVVSAQPDELAAVVGLAAVVVVEAAAAPGLDGPPLQAATATPAVRVAAVMNAARRNRGRGLGSV